MSFFSTFVIIVMGILVIVLMILHIINGVSQSTWFCKIMGWHQTPLDIKHIGGDNYTGQCPRCGKHILLDSQGGWS